MPFPEWAGWCFMDSDQRAALAPGTRLSVRIDPNDPTRVEIDTYGQF
jgi:hypothetical protein